MFTLEQYAAIARKTVADSCVLLKNENQTLPLRKGDKVAIFGRCAYYYYKSGLGSGGMVNTRYVVNIPEALEACEDIAIDKKLKKYYEDWISQNPVDEGNGWGNVPWSQKEMPVTDTIIELAKTADIALVIIGRTAGEDQDNKIEEGSYLLTKTEREMIQKVSAAFERTAVVLNVGNLIDMGWVDEYHPAAVLYAWQGGQEGGNGVADVLTGKVTPSGKLTDTVAGNIIDYPSTKNFGNEEKNYYQEDIYVGYRYFETFAREKVKYPFGFGLSYTQFCVDAKLGFVTVNDMEVSANVKNIGKTAGREVVQIYVKAPQGSLGKPARVLVGFQKTRLLQPGESETVQITCQKTTFASFDDSGVTGHKNCFVLEKGEYIVYAGSDVRSATCCGSYSQELQIIERLEEACAPVEEFQRYKASEEDGRLRVTLENVPTRTVDMEERMRKLRKKEIPYTGNKGYLLKDVLIENVTLDAFVGQLSDTDLMCLFHGEGMCSPKVTAGTASAFGGVTDNLKSYGIPIACCADGPSGIRMDCGTKAFSLPIGTALGCTFDLPLIEELFQYVGLELRKNKIDTLLGPGINIHRNPLNGRNFEYFSEDPLLTGKICTAQLCGMEASETTGTIKHFCANNQEYRRHSADAIVSQRALREIYLKPFEIAVKEGHARTIMTSYGPLNGRWTSSSFDLCTTVLREQWKYEGIVMSDWWAAGNWEGGKESVTNRAPMVIAQNDLYMCCDDAEQELLQDNVKEMYEKGVIERADLQRNAKNILQFIMHSLAMSRWMNPELLKENDEAEIEQIDEENYDDITFFEQNQEGKIVITHEDMVMTKEEIVFGMITNENAEYEITVEVTSNLSELAQLPISVYMNNIFQGMLTFQGMNGGTAKKICGLGHMMGRNHYIKLKCNVKGIRILKLVISKKK